MSTGFIYVIVLVLNYFCLLVEGTDCRSGWMSHGGSCYHFSHDKESWMTAVQVCERFDGMLAEIETEAESQFLQTWINRFNTNFWIGGTDLEEEGVWIWVNSKKPLTYSHWAPHEPNSANTDENCIDLRPNQAGWNDERCWAIQNYVCEIASESIGIVG